MSINRTRGSIALARSLCYQINGAADDNDDMDGGGYGSVDIAEILSAEVVRLQKALAQLVFDCPRCGHCCPEAEPVAWIQPGLRDWLCVSYEKDDVHTVPVYPHPPLPQAQPVLQDIEQYRMQIAGICTAAIGYWKNGDGIHPDYDTLALRDVAKLYAKYDALYKAQPVFDCPRCGHVCSQREWVGLTDEDWEHIHDRKETALDTFAQGAVWAADQLKERNT